jgi:hypothetical protein
VASRKKRYPPVSFTPGMPLFCAKAYSRVWNQRIWILFRGFRSMVCTPTGHSQGVFACHGLERTSTISPKIEDK